MKSKNKSPIVICPKCKSCILDENNECEHCANGLSLMDVSTENLDADSSHKVKKSSFSWFILKAGLILLLISFVGLVVGLVIANVMSDCNCNESLICSDCGGADELLTLLISGGFFGIIISFLLILPLSLIIGFFSSLLGNKK